MWHLAPLVVLDGRSPVASEDTPELFHATVKLLKLLVQSIAQVLHHGGVKLGSTCRRCRSRAFASLEASPAPAASRFHNSWARHARAYCFAKTWDTDAFVSACPCGNCGSMPDGMRTTVTCDTSSGKA